MVRYEQICPNCGKEYMPILAQKEGFEAKFRLWRDHGNLVQNVWPAATAIEREQLMSGICSDKCWDEFNGVL